MKKLLLAALLLFSLAIPSSSDAGGLPDKYWLCMQQGVLHEKRVFIISDIQHNNWNDYKHREKTYLKSLEKIFKNKLRIF